MHGRGVPTPDSEEYPLKQLAPIRLCAICVTQTDLYGPCSREHLKKLRVSGNIRSPFKGRKEGDNRVYNNPKLDSDIRKFNRNLDRLDQKAFTNNDVKLLSNLIVANFAESARLLPAGPSHCSVIFGPLVMEIGVPK